MTKNVINFEEKRQCPSPAGKLLATPMLIGYSTSTYPTSISNMRMPSAHQSTALLWPLFWIISGARYSGVPHRVHVLTNT